MQVTWRATAQQKKGLHVSHWPDVSHCVVLALGTGYYTDDRESIIDDNLKRLNDLAVQPVR